MTVQVIAPGKTSVTGPNPIPDPLERPGIKEAKGSLILDPKEVYTTNPNRLTAEIKRTLQGLLETDGLVVTLTGWNKDEPRGSYISNDGKPLPFGPQFLRSVNLGVQVVAFNLRQKIKVEYTVSRDGEDPVPSLELELDVLDIKPEDLNPGAILGKDNEDIGPVLDLTTDTDDRTVRIYTWPLIAIGQWFWIVLKGKDKNGDPYELTLFKGQVEQDLITLGYIEVPVLYSWLKLLGDGTALTLMYKVAFDQVEDESKANLSEVRSYTVKGAAVVAPTIGGVQDAEGTSLLNPGTTSKTPLKLTGTVAAGKKVDIFNGTNKLGEATTTGDTWEFGTEELSPDTYEFKAVEQGVGGPESATWPVTVTAVVAPTIGGVQDAEGTSLLNPGTTSKTPLKLTGTVAAGKKVDIFNGTNKLGEATTTGDTWEFGTEELSPDTYEFKAVEQGVSGPESASWTVTVQPVETEKPVIESAKDSSNNDVPHESITEATTLDLTIKAGKFEQLRILLNGVPGDQAPANGDGVLHYRLAGLKPGDQNITVMGITSELVSVVYNVFVVAGPSDGKLAIIAAKDAQHDQVLRGGAMTTTTITLTGTAQPSARVTISDVFTVLKTVVADLNGYWRLTLDDLKVHYYHLALSAEDAVPPMLWWLAVFDVGTPIIERATDLAGTTLIPPYGETSGRAFTLSGVGPANGTLTLHELLSEVETLVNVDAEGKWKHTIHIDQPVREYHYVAFVPGGAMSKSNLYRVRKVAPAQ